MDLTRELNKIRKKGWIKSARKGDGGIGKTVENRLGIRENNSGEPDCLYRGLKVEIKARRTNTRSMITLFTLEPRKGNLNDTQLIKRHGYIDRKGRQALAITISPNNFKHGLRLKVERSKGMISITSKSGKRLWVWRIANIRLKLQNLCIVYANAKKDNQGQEYFKIQKAILTKGLSVKCFFDLVARGIVRINLRMHLNEKGGIRNHGTAFRLLDYEHLQSCYTTSRVIVP